MGVVATFSDRRHRSRESSGECTGPARHALSDYLHSRHVPARRYNGWTESSASVHDGWSGAANWGCRTTARQRVDGSRFGHEIMEPRVVGKQDDLEIAEVQDARMLATQHAPPLRHTGLRQPWEPGKGSSRRLPNSGDVRQWHQVAIGGSGFASLARTIARTANHPWSSSVTRRDMRLFPDARALNSGESPPMDAQAPHIAYAHHNTVVGIQGWPMGGCLRDRMRAGGRWVRRRVKARSCGRWFGFLCALPFLAESVNQRPERTRAIALTSTPRAENYLAIAFVNPMTSALFAL